LQGWRLGGGGGDVGSPLGADRTPRGATQLAALTTAATASQRRRRVQLTTADGHRRVSTCTLYTCDGGECDV
jgi:hypothetical protein